ncbi:MAG: hypothetical protein ACP5JR_05170, partial [Thermoplasmata archaeon]
WDYPSKYASELSKFIQIIAKQNGRLEILHGMKATLLSNSTSSLLTITIKISVMRHPSCLVIDFVADQFGSARGTPVGVRLP